jgi:hypothetical protein
MRSPFILQALAEAHRQDMLDVADRHRLVREARRGSPATRLHGWLTVKRQARRARSHSRRLVTAFENALASAVTSAERQELWAASMRADWQPFADARRLGG